MFKKCVLYCWFFFFRSWIIISVLDCVDLLHENWTQVRWNYKVNDHERTLHITEFLWAGIYCKPTFICGREIFASFATALSSRIYISLRTSLRHMIVITKRMLIRLGLKNKSPQTSLSQNNCEIKSKRIKAGLQYVYGNFNKMHISFLSKQRF